MEAPLAGPMYAWVGLAAELPSGGEGNGAHLCRLPQIHNYIDINYITKMTLAIFGERQTGEDVRSANVAAVMAVANILRSSLGPHGLDKMLVDDIAPAAKKSGSFALAAAAVAFAAAALWFGDVVVTNDGATILKQLEVQHPAAKVLVDLSDLQDKEVGDGTTSVVLLSSELLRLSVRLIKNDLHPTAVIAGYRLAMKLMQVFRSRLECVRYLKSHLSVEMQKLEPSLLLSVAKTSLASKFIGTEEDFFANLCVTAIQSVKMDFQGSPSLLTHLCLDSVAEAAIEAESTRGLLDAAASERSSGAAPHTTAHPPCADHLVAAEAVSLTAAATPAAFPSATLPRNFAVRAVGAALTGMPMVVKDAKIALLDFGLRQHRMQLGVSIQVNDPEALEKIRQQEKDIARQRIKQILQSGANVIVTTQGIDDMCLKYFVEAGALAIRRVSKKDIRRIAKATGDYETVHPMTVKPNMVRLSYFCCPGTVCLTLATLEGDEVLDPAALGTCTEVCEERVGDWDYLFFRGCKTSKAATIILRGANEFMLDEVERSVHDALCAVSRCLSSSSVCPGGGTVEAALSVYLEDFARTLGSREQLAVAAFAEALLVIPKTLALNAALDATELVAKLRASHAKLQCGGDAATADPKALLGLDLVNGKLCPALNSGIVEATISKTKSFKFATEAAVTILRIDDFIRLSPEPERKERD
ncbi:hypothetical protein Emag_002061 [Eimeria magna]